MAKFNVAGILEKITPVTKARGIVFDCETYELYDCDMFDNVAVETVIRTFGWVAQVGAVTESFPGEHHASRDVVLTSKEDGLLPPGEIKLRVNSVGYLEGFLSVVSVEQID